MIKSRANLGLKSRLIIVDGNAILHRAYHAMPALTTSKGELVNAVYGFTSILLKIFHDFHPEYVCVCFDKKAPTFRKEKYKEYQAKRPKMVEELVGQIERVHEIVSAMNIPIFEKDGYEADDVIGTLVDQATQAPVADEIFHSELNRSLKEEAIVAQGSLKTPQKNLSSPSASFLEIIIVTGDRDLLQLVDQNIKVYLPVKGLSQSALFDEAGVKEKMGVLPKQIPDLKGLIGDQSDNYPGVSGIGPKTAVNLLQKYGSFRGIFDQLDQLTKLEKKTAEKLRLGREMGELSFELATIRRDAPVKLKLEDCQLTDYDFKKISALLSELEFHSMISRLPKDIHEIEKTEDKKAEDENDSQQISLF